MPENPLISVIVPTCNRRDLLPRALGSLAGQTWRGFEVIIVNDGEDEVTDIASHFANAGQNALDITLVIHPRSRLGLPAARNSGAAKARGKYLAYLDDDDILYPGQLAQLSGLAEAHGLPVVYSDYRLVGLKMEEGELRPVGVWEYMSEQPDFTTLAATNISAVFTFMHRADCLKRSGRFAAYLRGHEDWDLWQRMARHYPFTYLPEMGGDYMCRMDGASMSGQRQYMGESWLFSRRQGALMQAMPPVYELEKNAAEPRWLGARPSSSRPASVIIPVGEAGAFLADERAMAAFASTCARLGESELILAGFGPDMPHLYQRAMGLRHQSGQGGPLRCAWFFGDCGRLLAWNRAAGQAAGQWLLFLEPYVEPAADNWLDELLACAQTPESGAVAPLAAAAGLGRFLGGRMENGEPAFNLAAAGDKPVGACPADCLSSICLLLRRELFLEEGGFSINYAPGHYADADLCLRLARRGLVNRACAGARVTWGKGVGGLAQSPAGLIGRRLFWDVWARAPFDLPSLIRGADWSKRPPGLAALWPSEGRLPTLLDFPLPEKFR